MDVFELLKNDHKKVAQLFDQIESASGAAKKRTFEELRTELDLHAQLEERLFYPRLENTKTARDITLEAYEEHNVVKDLLAELAKDGMGDEWDAKLKVLRENVEHHVEEEEGELFDKAEDELSEEQVEQIGAQMEAEKERVLGSAATNGAGRGRTGSKKSPGKKRASKGGGVLSKLANFVGLGETSESSRKTAQKGSSSSKGSKKSAKKAASKGGAKKSGGRSSGAGKAATKASSSNRGGGKKKATKSGGSKGGAKKRSSKK